MIGRVPLLFLTPMLVAGILVALAFPNLPSELFTGCLFGSVGLCAALLYIKSKYRWRINFTWLILLPPFLLGTTRVLQTDSRNQANVVTNLPLLETTLVVEVLGSRPSSRGFVLETRAIRDGSGLVSGKVLMLIDSGVRPETGSWLVVQGKLDSIRPPTNPNTFHYKNWLGTRQIYRQVVADTFKWIRPPERTLGYWSIQVREWAVAKIDVGIQDAAAAALLKALLLGVQEDIPPEVFSAFRSSGTLHVLAVSGLHVAIIFSIVLFILKPLYGTKTGTWIATITGLALLWFYAFVTGLTPSVLRAAWVFSFVVLAKPLRRNVNYANLLAGSAFILLVADPRLVLNLGFQLSYAAVTGILIFNKPISETLPPLPKIPEYLWGMITVSMAAQLGTLPIILYNFHQVPVWFIAANLVLIPLSTFILVCGILYLMIPEFLLEWPGFLVEQLTLGMIRVAHIAGSLPWATIENIYVNGVQTVLLAAGLLAGGWYLITNNRLGRNISLGCALCFAACAFWQQSNRDTAVMVYRFGNKSAVEYARNRVSVFIGPEVSGRLSEVTAGFRRTQLVTSTIQLPLESGYSWQTGGLTWGLIRPGYDYPDADVWIVTENALDPDEVTTLPGLLIFDCSNSQKYIKEMYRLFPKVPKLDASRTGLILLPEQGLFIQEGINPLPAIVRLPSPGIGDGGRFQPGFQ